MMEFVSWDDYSQYMDKNKKCSKPPISRVITYLAGYGRRACRRHLNIWKDKDMFQTTNQYSLGFQPSKFRSITVPWVPLIIPNRLVHWEKNHMVETPQVVLVGENGWKPSFVWQNPVLLGQIRLCLLVRPVETSKSTIIVAETKVSEWGLLNVAWAMKKKVFDWL